MFPFLIYFIAGTCCNLHDKGKLENDWDFYNSSDNFPLPCLAWPYIPPSCRDRLLQVSGHMEGILYHYICYDKHVHTQIIHNSNT